MFFLDKCGLHRICTVLLTLGGRLLMRAEAKTLDKVEFGRKIFLLFSLLVQNMKDDFFPWFLNFFSIVFAL